jgi:hypothetical protein
LFYLKPYCLKSNDKGGNLYSKEAILIAVSKGCNAKVKSSKVANVESILGFYYGPKLWGSHSRCSRHSKLGGMGLSKVEISRKDRKKGGRA